MKLSTLEINDSDTAVMTVMDPRDRMQPLLDDNGAPMTLTMVGMDSPRVRAAGRRSRAKSILERVVTPGAVMMDEAMAGLAKAEQRDIELVASAVTNWSGIGLDEDVTPFSFAKCVEAFTRLPWLFDQTNIFLGNRANFMKASQKV